MHTPNTKPEAILLSCGFHESLGNIRHAGIKDTLSITDEKLFKACRSVCSLEPLKGRYPYSKCENFTFYHNLSLTIEGISLLSCIYVPIYK